MSYDGVKRLAIENSEWLPVVRSCLRLARKVGPSGFAGRWVLNDLQGDANWKGMRYQDTTKQWFPGLRMLVRCGILEHLDTTRAGRRAYYAMADPDGVERALRELGFPP